MTGPPLLAAGLASFRWFVTHHRAHQHAFKHPEHTRLPEPRQLPQLPSSPRPPTAPFVAQMVSSTHEHHDYVRRAKFSVPVQREAVERDWRPRGYSCDVFVDPPGKEWRDFSHKEDELVTVVEGRMEFTVGGDRLELGPGDECFIPAGVKHSTRNIGDGEARWLFGYA